jgi:diguanylate cyclase
MAAVSPDFGARNYKKKETRSTTREDQIRDIADAALQAASAVPFHHGIRRRAGGQNLVRQQPGPLGIAMRATVGIKLGVWLALFGIVSNAFTDYYIYLQSRDILIRAAEEKLLTATQVLARRVNHSLEEAVNDLRFIAALPSVQRLADPRLPQARRQEEARKLEEIFASLLASHDDYFRVRVIGAADNGRELVRVDRDTDGVRIVRGADLQEQGRFPYVSETLLFEEGDVYFSRINITRENGAHQGVHKPALRIGTPLRAGGTVFGVIIVNIDLDGMFDRMRTDIPGNISVILTNEHGDYLIHPDIAKTFRVEHDRRIRIQDDLPGIAPAFDRHENNLVLTATPPDAASETVGAFVRVPFGAPGDNRFMLVGLSTPLEHTLQDSRQLGLHLIRISLVLSLLAVAVSMLLSRLLTKPLNAMAKAISHFEAGKPLQGLPVHRKDEIGYLAKAFQSMTARLNTQVGDLQNKQLHLDYMAHHDPLTKLPNRVLFLDRLIQAINTAHRNKRQFAVMFIDLDKFKEINDTLGHHVGDEVLKEAALRMQSVIRKEDTISRLGGDEFTIILQDLRHEEQYPVVARKLLELFQRPFTVENHQFALTCSIGISIYPKHGEQAEELLEHADAAMYQVKKRGGNQYQLFNREDLAQ